MRGSLLTRLLPRVAQRVRNKQAIKKKSGCLPAGQSQAAISSSHGGGEGADPGSTWKVTQG
jgi:hypothetical protein